MASRNVGTRYGLCAPPWVVLPMWASGCAAPSPSSTVQVFTGSTPAVSPMPSANGTTLASTPSLCDQRVLRAVTFIRKSNTTRLRIT